MSSSVNTFFFLLWIDFGIHGEVRLNRDAQKVGNKSTGENKTQQSNVLEGGGGHWLEGACSRRETRVKLPLIPGGWGWGRREAEQRGNMTCMRYYQ